MKWPLLLFHSVVACCAPLKFTSRIVPKEYVAIFTSRMSVDAQRDALDESLGRGSWLPVKGSRPFTGEGEDSDFAVIKIEGGEELVGRLRESPLVKHVVQERRIMYSHHHRHAAEVGEEEAQEEEVEWEGGGQVQGEEGEGGARRLMSISDNYQANRLWEKGYSGQHVRVAIFDTGIDKSHSHFNHVEDRSNWTDEDTLEDRLGHGTFVAGVVASKFASCHGFAEQAEVHTFRVFTQSQMSFTSWFLDAFNYAIASRIDILNLSIGGPDYHDRPFIDKVLEMSANNIIVVSAIGNDGPLWGTLNNPADQPDVIGVGGIDYQGKIAHFSSRGMSTWELPRGYGRVKPDIVAYGKDVPGSSMNGGCRTLSGTSVASPVVTGAVTLLASTIAVPRRPILLNPASMKQALVESATRLPIASIFEQGAGNLNVYGAFEVLSVYQPRASIFPQHWDITPAGCPYFWPFCTQSLYAGAQPVIINSTILNGMNELGRVDGDVKVQVKGGAGCLKIAVEHSGVIWPWVGYIAVILTVEERCRLNPTTTEEITISINVQSPARLAASAEVQTNVATMSLKVEIIPTPKREKRILWDQYHNLQYPPGFSPRDNIHNRDFLDWNGDHPHTNFRGLYNKIKEAGYFLEILGQDYTCFDGSEYGVLMIVDSEDDFRPDEVAKIEKDVKEKGLSLLVLAEWYNEEVMKKITFFDDNTQLWWTPQIGGGNVPALNQLLKPFGAALTDTVWSGEFKVGSQVAHIKSGPSLARWPAGGSIWVAKMQNEVAALVHSKKGDFHEVAMMGILEAGFGMGRVAVLGDSSCVDDKEIDTSCWWAVNSLLHFAGTGQRSGGMEDLSGQQRISAAHHDTKRNAPEAMSKTESRLYSRTVDGVANCLTDYRPPSEGLPSFGSPSKEGSHVGSNATASSVSSVGSVGFNGRKQDGTGTGANQKLERMSTSSQASSALPLQNASPPGEANDSGTSFPRRVWQARKWQHGKISLTASSIWVSMLGLLLVFCSIFVITRFRVKSSAKSQRVGQRGGTALLPR